jgi:hypothetical protein
MVSGTAPQSFFGFPPASLRPAAVDRKRPATSNAKVVSSTAHTTNPKDVIQGAINDLRDAREDGDRSTSSNGTGITQSITSTQSSGTSALNNGIRASTSKSEGSSTNSQVPQRIPTNVKLRIREYSSPG